MRKENLEIRANWWENRLTTITFSNTREEGKLISVNRQQRNQRTKTTSNKKTLGQPSLTLVVPVRLWSEGPIREDQSRGRKNWRNVKMKENRGRRACLYISTAFRTTYTISGWASSPITHHHPLDSKNTEPTLTPSHTSPLRTLDVPCRSSAL